MEQQFEAIEMQIWEYLDGAGTAEARKRVEQLIATNELWQKKHAELSAFHSELNAMETGQPSMRFTQNVMDAVADVKIATLTTKYLDNWAIKGFVAFFSLTILASLIYILTGIDWSAAKDSSLDLSKYLDSDILNLVMLVNVILALMLVDKLMRRGGKYRNPFL